MVKPCPKCDTEYPSTAAALHCWLSHEPNLHHTLTLKQMGDRLAVSRERIRQVLQAFGISRRAGTLPKQDVTTGAGRRFIGTRRQRISSGSPYEPLIGFSRAVRVANTVYVSGTVGWGDDGKLAGTGDVYLQAVQAIRNIEKALKEAGALLSDIVRTRVYLTDIARMDEAAKAHGEAFGEIRPASTFVAVTALAEPEMLVEIEAVAVL